MKKLIPLILLVVLMAGCSIVNTSSTKDLILPRGPQTSVSETLAEPILDLTSTEPNSELPEDITKHNPHPIAEDYPRFPAKVVKVVDGDTIHVLDESGQKLKVRLIGIDTPESVHPDKSKNTEEGKIASDFTRSILSDKDVEVELDVQETDRYGRTLAYIYVDGLFFNEYIVKEGYANVSTYPPNTRYESLFLSAQQESRELEKGFWSHDFWD